MKNPDLRRRFAALLLVLCLAAACAVPACAAQTGSLHVALYDHQNDMPLRGGELTLYRVADAQLRGGTIHYTYTGDFAACTLPLTSLTADLAWQLERKLPPVPVIAAQQDISETGFSDITDLPQGLYLVVQTEPSHGYAPIHPFLVSIPLWDGSGWLYDVDASPKIDTVLPQTPAIAPLTPEMELEPAQPGTPGSAGADTAASPTAPTAPGSAAAPADSAAAPADSTATTPTDPDAAAADAAAPAAPAKPTLPQTGQLVWPIPLLALLGVLLFAIGWHLDRSGKKEG